MEPKPKSSSKPKNEEFSGSTLPELVVEYTEGVAEVWEGSESSNTTGGVVSFDPSTKTISCSPPQGSSSYTYRLQFDVPEALAPTPTHWSDPSSRPSWVSEPEVSEDRLQISFVVTDAVTQSPSESCQLWLQVEGAAGIRRIDPTIVSNPPN